MQFKLGKFCSGIGFSGLVVLSSLVASPAAHATLQVTYLTNGAGPPFFFASHSSQAALSGTLLTGSKDLDNDTTNITDPSDSNIIYFNVFDTNTTFKGNAATTPAMLVVTISGTASPSVRPVPIISYYLPGTNPALCTGSSSTACWDPISLTNWSNPAGSLTVFRAVAIQPQQNVIVGLNVREICDAYIAAGGQADGCQSKLTEPTAGTITSTTAQLTLTFGVYIAPGAVTATGDGYLNLTSPTALDSTPVQVYLSSTGPSADALVCNMSGAEIPNDGSMVVDGTAFSIDPAKVIAGVPEGLQAVYVLAKKVSAVPPASNPTAASVNSRTDTVVGSLDIDTPVPIATAQRVGGFENTTDPASPINYAVGFVGEDGFGFLVDNPGSCAYTHPFQTAAVLGFLDASKCFIATATFRSMDAAPLVLLRAFRDRFLEHFGLGRGFVRWYYHWSPPAADWLVAHPVFRFPVFLALIPLQTLAWLILHRLAFTILLMGALSLLGYVLVIRLRWPDEREQPR